MLAFAHEQCPGAAEVEQQHVANAMLEANAHAVRSMRVVGVQHVAFHAVDEIDDLILSADVDVVPEHAVKEKLHAYTRSEVE